MASTAQPVRDQLRETISRLVHRGLGVEDYWRAVSDALDGAVPSEGSCPMTMGPGTYDAKSGVFPRAESLRPFGSSQSSCRPRAVRSRK